LRKPAVCSLKDIVEWLKVGTFKHAGTCSTEVIVRYLSLPSARILKGTRLSPPVS